MLVDVQAAHLSGFLRPVADQPGFVLLIFRTPVSNRLLGQDLGSDDTLRGFRVIEPPSEEGHIDCSILAEREAPALYGYAFPGELPFVGPREAVVNWLSPRVPQIENPLLRLQAADFCALDKYLPGAWRDSFAQLESVSRENARAWRDAVVLPARVRQAVARAIERYGIEARGRDLGRDVTVRVVKGRLRAFVAHDLHQQLAAATEALDAISDDTADVRRAFSLSELVIVGKRPEAELALIAEETEEEEAALTIAVGSRAAAIAEKALVDRQRPRLRLAHPRVPADFKVSTPVAVHKQTDLIFQGDAEVHRLDDLLPISFGARVPLLFVFSATAETISDAEHAFRLARDIDRRYYRTIAVIPHLPDTALARDLGRYQDLLTSLADLFDAVCILSDQSPHMGPGLPFGPSRSLDAAATRLRRLVTLLPDLNLEMPGHRGLRKDSGLLVHLFSSVNDSGRLNGERLIDHALARATQSELDWRGAAFDVAFAGAARIKATDYWQGFTHREGFVATDARQEGDRTGPIRAAIHIAGAQWTARPIEAFEGFCRTKLEQHGWRVISRSDDGYDFDIERDGIQAHATCKMYGAGEDSRPLRSRLKRRGASDMIMLTDATIHRSDFVRHLLNGRLPVHVSRIGSLPTIYAQRYLYLLRALRAHSYPNDGRLLDAAFDFLARSLSNGDAPAAVKTALRPGAPHGLSIDPNRSNVELFSDVLRVELVIVTKARNLTSLDHRVGMELTREGWHVDQRLMHI